MSEDFEIKNGVLIKYHGSDEHVTIPDGVREIGEMAFRGCGVTTVMIPDGVTRIGTKAFMWCTSLTSVTIPDSVTKIEDRAFWTCTSLTSVTIPDSVTEISEGVFNSCSSLASITLPNSIVTIGDWAFGSCSRLTSVKIPDSVTKIGRYAFSSCISLNSVTIPDSVTGIGEGTFENCTNLTLVRIPDSVTEIGDSVFEDCFLLTVVCSEDSDAHRYCEMWHVTYIFDYQHEAFGGVVPPGIEKIASPFPADEEAPFVFISYSHKDRDTILPIIKQLYEKGWKIWYDEGLTIGDKYDEVLEKHVKDCSAFLLFVTENSVNSYYIKENEIPWAVKYEKPIIKCILGEGIDYETDEGNVTAIAKEPDIEAALERIQGLAKGEKRTARGISVVVNPNERGEKAGEGFAYCIYSKKSAVMAKSVLLEAKMGGCNIYDAVQNGEDNEKLRTCACLVVLIDKAFISDAHLMGLLIAEFKSEKDIAACQIEEIAESDMSDELIELHRRHWLDFAHGITHDMITKLSQHLQKRGCRDASVLPGFDYDITESGIMIKRYRGFASELKIEHEYGGIPVVEIADRAFENCIYLREIDIPDGVTIIGERAFSCCKSLTSVIIPDTVTEIGEWAFKYCSKLNSIIILKNVSKIGDAVFDSCEALTTVTILGSVTKIGESAFYGCKNLTYVSIPDSVKIIEEYAFSNCKKLASIIIPNGVTEFGECAFYGCASLTSVTIPFSVTEIEVSAFGYCISLASVIIENKKTKIANDAFADCHPDLVIRAPKDSLAYKYALSHGIRFEEL